MKKNLLLSLALAAPVAVVAQTRTVSGRVTAVADGTGLPGVTVLERGTNNGASTDADGNFRLTVQPGATLVFSSIGFATQQVVVGDQSTINLKLQADQTLLNETVIVGYGSQSKADLTGSVTQISAKEVENVPVQSFEQAIQGRTPGVNISQTSGKLGAGLQIRVRGSSSVTASNQPLYVIDGIPVTSQDAGSDTEPLNPLADLNPNDIESITILKDASSSAIYGARASNGVILVTTKKGRQGQTKVNVGYYVGTSTATKKRKFLNAAQYKELFSEALNNSGYIGPDPDTQYPTLEDAFAYEAGIDYNSPYDSDWVDAGLRRGNVAQYDFNVSGGDAKTRFFLSTNYSDQKGIILGNRYRRGSARLNLDHSIRDNVKVGLNFSLARSVNDRVSEDNAFSNPIQLNALPPLQPIRTEDGKLNQATLYYNNLLDQEDGRNRSGNYRSFSTAFLSYEPVKGLTLRTEAGADFLNLNEDLYRAAGTQDGGNTGYGYSNQAQVVNYTTNNTATYNRTVAENHNFDALLGFSFQRSVSQQTSAEGRGFPNSEFKRINSAAVKTAGSGSSLSEFSFISYFGRLNYAFKNKYLVSGSVRRDGSSRFGSDNLYGTFGAGSLGWVVSEESFLQDNKVLTFLKLRASYGITGNAEIGNYDSRSLYSAIFYADQAGVTPSTRLGNPRLTWENTAQTDLGVEFGLFNNRINGEVDVYQKNTSDLLLNRQLNYVRGYSNVTENLGKLRNRGLEISLNGLVVDKAVKWNVGGNISFNRNEVTNLVEPIIAGGNTLAQVRSGEPIGVFWGRKYAGVDVENGDALYYTADGGTTNNPALAAQQKVGNPNPQYTGGVNTSVSWKGLDFTALGQFVYGNDIYNTAGVYQSVNGDYFDNQTIDQLKRWQKPGDITGVPQARLNAANGTQVSSRWVTGGSFFRGKTFTLGYTLPAELSKKGYLSSARIYVSAQNLFTITNYDGYDPEVNTATFGGANYVLGHDFYTPPLSKTFLVGVNLGL